MRMRRQNHGASLLHSRLFRQDIQAPVAGGESTETNKNNNLQRKFTAVRAEHDAACRRHAESRKHRHIIAERHARRMIAPPMFSSRYVRTTIYFCVCIGEHYVIFFSSSPAFQVVRIVSGAPVALAGAISRRQAHESHGWIAALFARLPALLLVSSFSHVVEL